MKANCKCGGRMEVRPNRQKRCGETVNVRVCNLCGHRVERRVRRSDFFWRLQKMARVEAGG